MSRWKSFCACIGAFDENAAERLTAAGTPVKIIYLEIV
jgi:hypothetical protein